MFSVAAIYVLMLYEFAVYLLTIGVHKVNENAG